MDRSWGDGLGWVGMGWDGLDGLTKGSMTPTRAAIRSCASGANISLSEIGLPIVKLRSRSSRMLALSAS